MSVGPTRRSLLAGAVLGALTVSLSARVTDAPHIEVFKSASCSCCLAWVEHLTQSGFNVRVTPSDEPAKERRRLGMPDVFGSCHTATVSGYVLEGHVPAADIRKLLDSAPSALGLAVPGMPVGSPGMEMGTRREAFNVILVDRQGQGSTFTAYNAR